MALGKPAGGIRPIAVGEILRRLTGKCLMSVVREDARSYFWPVQVGVGVPKGAEKAVHCVRAWAHRNSAASDKVLLKLDFSNAFNCVSREVALSQARKHFPALAQWSMWCYREPSRLQFGEHVLASSSGVQQGDPLGPPLFAGAIQPLARELKASPLELAVQFLDDGVIAGDVPTVGAAVLGLERKAADIGLTLNLSKCEVVAAGSVDYLPAWAGSAVAFDCAVTATQRPETLAQACREAGASAAVYARHKEYWAQRPLARHQVPAHGRRDHRQLGCRSSSMRCCSRSSAWRCAPTVHEPRCGAAVNSTSDGRAACCRRPTLSPSWRGLRVVCRASCHSGPAAASSSPRASSSAQAALQLPPADAWSMCVQVRTLQIVAVMLRPRLVTSKLLLFSSSSYHSLLSCFAQV